MPLTDLEAFEIDTTNGAPQHEARSSVWGYAMADQECLARLLAIASDRSQLVNAQEIAAQKLLQFDGEVYPADGCAITLSVLLQLAGLDIADCFQAIVLGNELMKRGWTRVAIGEQKAGDVGSTCESQACHGQDHIYLILRPVNTDEVVIADNQSQSPHFRSLSGEGGKTPTRFIVRAS